MVEGVQSKENYFSKAIQGGLNLIVDKIRSEALSYRRFALQTDQQFLTGRELTSHEVKELEIRFIKGMELRLINPSHIEIDTSSFNIAREKIADILKSNNGKVIFITTHTIDLYSGILTLPDLMPNNSLVKIISRPFPKFVDRLVTSLLNRTELQISPKGFVIEIVKRVILNRNTKYKNSVEINLTSKDQNSGIGSVDLINLKEIFSKPDGKYKALFLAVMQGVGQSEVAVPELGNQDYFTSRSVAYLRYGIKLDAPIVPIIFVNKEERIYVEIGDVIKFKDRSEITNDKARDIFSEIESFFGKVLRQFPKSWFGEPHNRFPNIVNNDPNREKVETAPRVGLLAISYAMRTFTQKWANKN